jgi:homoserine kinase type II
MAGLAELAHGRADEVEPGLRALITAELAHLEACWPEGLPAGVIHADLFPDNVFFLKDRLSGLIDFISPATTCSPMTLRSA